MIYQNYPPSGYAVGQPAFIEKAVVKRSGNHVGFFVLLFFVGSMLWQYIYMAVMLLMGYSYEKIVETLSDTVILMSVNILLTTAIFIGGGFICSKMEQIPIRETVHLVRPKKGLFVPAVLMGIGFCYVANIATALFANNVSFFFEPKGQDISLPTNPFGVMLVVISIAVFPALLEEFAMRGVVMGSLMRFGKSFAILVSAMIFGLLHGNLIQIPFAFLVGLVLGFIVFETGSLWTGVVVHFTNNLLSVLLEYASKNLSEKNANLLSMLLTLALISLGLFGFYLFTRKKSDLFQFQKTPHISTSKQRVKWFFSAPVMIFFIITVAVSVALTQLMALVPNS